MPQDGAPLNGVLQVHVVDLSVLFEVARDVPPGLPAPECAVLHARYAPGRRRLQAEASRVLTRAVPGAGGAADTPGFNVSHDSGLLALALTPWGGPCGIDVEDAPEDTLREVADRFCGSPDRALLSTERGARRLWAAKESVAKALGHGLRAGLRTIHFTGHPGRRWTAVTWRGRPTGLHTRVLDLGVRHMAVTTGVVPRTVRLTRWVPWRADGHWELRVERPAA